jgi:hypothetical protein
MHEFAHKFLAIVLLLSLPLQGLSAVLMPFHCVTDELHASSADGTQHHHEGVAHEHDSAVPATAQQDGAPSSNEAGHFCCEHVYTGTPSVAVLAAPDTPFVVENHIPTIPPLFFPEQLLRPPRT